MQSDPDVIHETTQDCVLTLPYKQFRTLYTHECECGRWWRVCYASSYCLRWEHVKPVIRKAKRFERKTKTLHLRG